MTNAEQNEREQEETRALVLKENGRFLGEGQERFVKAEAPKVEAVVRGSRAEVRLTLQKEIAQNW